MYNVEIQTDTDIVKHLNLTANELFKAAQFTKGEVARRAGVQGRKVLRELTGLPAQRATSRVKVNRSAGRVWFGGNEILAQPPLHQVKFGRKPRGRGGRPVLIDGSYVPGSFVWKKVDTTSRYANIPFKTVGNYLDSVRVDISEEVGSAFQKVSNTVPDQVDQIMLTKARQIVRSRK